MSSSDLLSKGSVEKFSSSDPNQIKNEIGIAINDVSSAKKTLGIGGWDGPTMPHTMQCCSQEEL